MRNDKFGSVLLRIWNIASINLLIALILIHVIDYSYGTLFKAHEPWLAKIEQVPYYSSQPWFNEFINDSDKASPRSALYAPFVVWRRPPLSSSTTNVDSKGRRHTPGVDCSKGSFRIFVYGGSTVWGSGAPDWGTIPAFLQKHLANRFHNRLCVVNLGESGWNSNQEVIQLMLNLREGDVPNVAIFYDGWNDRSSAYEMSNPYSHGRAGVIASKVNANGVAPHDLIRLVAPNLSRLLFVSQEEQKVDRHVEPGLMAKTISVYETNMNIAAALAQSHGFAVHFFWQPDLFHESRTLASGESEILSQYPPSFIQFVRTVKPRPAPDNTYFDNIGDVLDAVSDRVYLDHVHLTPPANEAIAKRIIDILVERQKL